MNVTWPTLLAGLLVSSVSLADYPVTVTSCDQLLTFHQAPSKAVSNDSNITEIMLALELQPQMAGYTGVGEWQTGGDEFAQRVANLKELSPKKANLEVLLGAGADLYFAGWNYGLNVGKEMTPANLAQFDIPTYVLSESCIHVMEKDKASMEDLYQDIRNLGLIFGVSERAEALVHQYQQRIHQLMANVPEGEPVKVWVYDSGEDAPFTAGPYAMPQAMIEAAGGVNVMDGLDSSWMKISWESVVQSQAEVIVIINYGETTAEQKIAFLQSHPGLQDLPAIQNQRFVVLNYEEATPGPRNIGAIEKLVTAFYP